METGILHLHVTVVGAFLLFYVIKVCLLLFREELVDRFRNKTKWLDMVLGSLIVVTGFYLLFIQPQILMWMIIKIVIVFASIPLGIIAMKRKSKGLAILSLVLLIYTYGVSETKSLTFSKKRIKTENGVVDGKVVFQVECIRCHGENGKAGNYGATDLTTSSLTSDLKMDIIKKGKGMMPAYEGKLKEEELKAVVDYIETLQ